MGQRYSRSDPDSGCRKVEQEFPSLHNNVILYSVEKKCNENLRVPQADSKYAATRQGVCPNELIDYHSSQKNHNWLDSMKYSRRRDDTQVKLVFVTH